MTEKTPGPYVLAPNRHIYWQPNESQIHAIAKFVSVIGEAEREEIVDLLNKGTHFEKMLEALKGNDEAMGKAIGHIEDGLRNAIILPRWQPIETAPEYEDVLVSEGGVVHVAYHKGLRGWRDKSTGGKLGYIPTHWMPVPALPEAQTGNKSV